MMIKASIQFARYAAIYKDDYEDPIVGKRYPLGAEKRSSGKDPASR